MADGWELGVLEETVYAPEGAIPIVWDRHVETNLWAIRSPAHRGLLIVGNGNERTGMRGRVAATLAALLAEEANGPPDATDKDGQ